jgi:chromosome segregation ATPase
MTTVEKRLQGVEKSVKFVADYVKQQTDKMEAQLQSRDEPLLSKNVRDELEEMRMKLDSISTERHISPLKLKSRDRFEERMEEKVGKLEERIAGMQSEEGKDQKAGNAINSVKKELEDFRHEITPKMHFIEARVNKIKEEVNEVSGATDLEDFKEKVEGIDKKLTHTLAMKTQLETLDRELTKSIKEHGMPAHLKDIQVDDVKKLKELDTRLKHIEEIKDFKKVLEDVEERTKYATREVDRLSQHHTTTRKSHEEVEKRVRTLEDRHATYDTDDIKKIAVDLMQTVERESSGRAAMEKKIRELEGDRKFLESFEKKIKEMDEQISRFGKDDTKIEEYIKKHAKVPETGKLEEEIENTRHALENEAAKRLSLEKRVHETEAGIAETQKKLEGINNIEELAKLGEKIHDMEKNMKMASVKLLTQQLNEFAKAMDRRIPNIVSREEYTRQVAEIHHKLKAIESPDFAPMGVRVERLEKKLNDIADLLRGLHNRVPVVVE